MTVDGDPVNGKFNDADPIPVTMGTEHLLSFTIDFGDMLMSYDLTDTSEANDYGWGQSFDGTNNKITVTNNSTCGVLVTFKLDIYTATYPCLKEPKFKLANTNEKSNPTTGVDATSNLLSYAGNTAEGSETSHDVYLVIKNTNEFTNMHNYNFNDAKIGEITVSFTPVLGTILTEEGYYVKVTAVNNLEKLANTVGFDKAIRIYSAVDSGIPYYFGPYETEDKANSFKTRLNASSTCSVIYIS